MRSSIVRPMAHQLVSVCAFAAVICVTACSNYTSSPVCDKTNLVELRGVSGSYEISIQDQETFEVQTVSVSIESAVKGKLVKKYDGGKAEESSVCQVKGLIVQEKFDDKINGYKQQFIYVHGAGITTYDLMFDRTQIERVGIPFEIFSMPENLIELFADLPVFGRFIAQSSLKAEKTLGMKVMNDYVNANRLFDFAKPAPVGITMFRK